RGLSPHPYLFWFLVGAPLMLQAAQESWLTVLAFLVGYYSTIVGSNVALALALHRWIGLFSDRVYRILLLISSAILAAYGLALVDEEEDEPPAGPGFTSTLRPVDQAQSSPTVSLTVTLTPSPAIPNATPTALQIVGQTASPTVAGSATPTATATSAATKTATA